MGTRTPTQRAIYQNGGGINTFTASGNTHDGVAMSNVTDPGAFGNYYLD